MKIKTKMDQLIEKRSHLETLIKWHSYAVSRAKKRYYIKSNWLFSFWINSNTDTLRHCYERERDILINLKDYLDVIEKMITNCHNEK